MRSQTVAVCQTQCGMIRATHNNQYSISHKCHNRPESLIWTQQYRPVLHDYLQKDQYTLDQIVCLTNKSSAAHCNMWLQMSYAPHYHAQRFVMGLQCTFVACLGGLAEARLCR